MAHENKVALVTGSNRGIGFETARQLGKQGATVVVSARTSTMLPWVPGSYVKKVSRLVLLLSM
jgi:NAD(P)-dependent dehydrogenase (short-subunit alcohol dehydrogenase family)